MDRLTRLLVIRLSIVIALAVMFLASATHASPVDEVSVASIDTHYANGLLTMEQDEVICVVEYEDNTQNFEMYDFHLHANLVQDLSTGGLAVGQFADGYISIWTPTDQPTLVLEMDLVSLLVQENPYLPGTVLTASGQFVVSNPEIAALLGPEGDVFSISWEVSGDIDSFDEGFTAESDITLTPVPEPATMAVLSLGGLGAFVRRRAGR
ncbi:MAG: PEP-CTERM sorting domain-containing protein [Phycisphaerae bacterium]